MCVCFHLKASFFFLCSSAYLPAAKIGWGFRGRVCFTSSSLSPLWIGFLGVFYFIGAGGSFFCTWQSNRAGLSVNTCQRSKYRRGGRRKMPGFFFFEWMKQFRKYVSDLLMCFWWLIMKALSVCIQIAHNSQFCVALQLMDAFHFLILPDVICLWSKLARRI